MEQICYKRIASQCLRFNGLLELMQTGQHKRSYAIAA